MNRFVRRLGVILAGAALALASVGASVAPASAHHTGGSNHYYGSCTANSTSGIVIGRFAEGGYYAPNDPPGTFYPSVTPLNGGQAWLRFMSDLFPCSTPGSGESSLSLILPVNLQGWGHVNNVWQHVQMGIGASDNSGGGGCGGSEAIAQYITQFVYTPNANTPGVLCRASWVDFNHDGTPDNPVQGRRYLMWIAEIPGDAGHPDTWSFHISDTDGTGNTVYKYINRQSSDGGLDNNGGGVPTFWSGCEVSSTSNELGVANGASGNTISEMAYWRASDGARIYTENSPTYNGWGSSIPSFYHPGQSQAGLGEQLNCYTDLHN